MQAKADIFGLTWILSAAEFCCRNPKRLVRSSRVCSSSFCRSLSFELLPPKSTLFRDDEGSPLKNILLQQRTDLLLPQNKKHHRPNLNEIRTWNQSKSLSLLSLFLRTTEESCPNTGEIRSSFRKKKGFLERSIDRNIGIFASFLVFWGRVEIFYGILRSGIVGEWFQF